jgi:hypothetical protein
MRNEKWWMMNFEFWIGDLRLEIWEEFLPPKTPTAPIRNFRCGIYDLRMGIGELTTAE